jgi:acyl carrier protein
MTSLDIAKGILADCLFIPRERVTDDMDIKSLAELDSLTFEMIVLEVEKRTGAELDPIVLLNMRTVKDLAKVLDQAA